MRLAGKKALVTGGSRSIGRAIALGFAREGADVAVNYVEGAAHADEVVHEIRDLGRQAMAVKADITDAAQVEAMVVKVAEAFGRIDVLVNNAGVVMRQPFLEMSEEVWDRVVDVDLKGVFLVGQAVARRMVAAGGGSIINISSIASEVASPGQSHYSAAKAGVTMLTRAMALELAPLGVRVNAIEPGMLLTDMNRERFANQQFLSGLLARMPIGRVGAPEDIAGAALYLASDESSFALGAVIRLDGGRAIG
ncbi:MAG: SDR family NAD(P)-dependent oxidoreductase [Chloroflexota bacterium]